MSCDRKMVFAIGQIAEDGDCSAIGRRHCVTKKQEKYAPSGVVMGASVYRGSLGCWVLMRCSLAIHLLPSPGYEKHGSER